MSACAAFCSSAVSWSADCGRASAGNFAKIFPFGKKLTQTAKCRSFDLVWIANEFPFFAALPQKLQFCSCFALILSFLVNCTRSRAEDFNCKLNADTSVVFYHQDFANSFNFTTMKDFLQVAPSPEAAMNRVLFWAFGNTKGCKFIFTNSHNNSACGLRYIHTVVF